MSNTLVCTKKNCSEREKNVNELETVKGAVVGTLKITEIMGLIWKVMGTVKGTVGTVGGLCVVAGVLVKGMVKGTYALI